MFEVRQTEVLRLLRASASLSDISPSIKEIRKSGAWHNEVHGRYSLLFSWHGGVGCVGHVWWWGDRQLDL